MEKPVVKMKNTIRFSNWILKRSNSVSDVLIISLITFIFVVVLCLLTRKKRQLYMMRYKSNHNWNFNDLITKAHCCSVCEQNIMLSAGWYCDTCQVYVDVKCLKKADKECKCKLMCKSNVSDSTRSHHWIKGNLPANSVCFKCSEACGDLQTLRDYQCVWCLRTMHEGCLKSARSEDESMAECDFGQFSNFILKPTFLFSNKQVNNKYYYIDDVQIDMKMRDLMSDWTPLIVFANTKSGSNDADLIMKHLRAILNPLQIINVNTVDPEKVFKWMAKYSDVVQFNILVCGGDGSVGWLLEIAAKIKFKKPPMFAILPLGTGNDLSRCLGWGEGYTGDVEITDVVKKVKLAENVRLDRWIVDFYKFEKIKSLSKGKSKFMNNYLSIGCDALVTLNFHAKRESLPFSNRLFNKLVYFQYGTIDTFLKECRFLTQNIQLELDGKVIKLPELESIVVLNVPYWGAGCRIWGEGENIPTQRIDDGVLEVCGIYSSFHVAQLQVGLAEPYRIGQAKSVRIKLLKRFPMQIDGEPWTQNPTVIEINHFGQAYMLKNNLTDEHED